jgi:hypothetical protein
VAGLACRQGGPEQVHGPVQVGHGVGQRAPRCDEQSGDGQEARAVRMTIGAYINRGESQIDSLIQILRAPSHVIPQAHHRAQIAQIEAAGGMLWRRDPNGLAADRQGFFEIVQLAGVVVLASQHPAEDGQVHRLFRVSSRRCGNRLPRDAGRLIQVGALTRPVVSLGLLPARPRQARHGGRQRAGSGAADRAGTVG